MIQNSLSHVITDLAKVTGHIPGIQARCGRRLNMLSIRLYFLLPPTNVDCQQLCDSSALAFLVPGLTWKLGICMVSTGTTVVKERDLQVIINGISKELEVLCTLKRAENPKNSPKNSRLAKRQGISKSPTHLPTSKAVSTITHNHATTGPMCISHIPN